MKFSAIFLRSYSLFNQFTTTVTNINIIILYLKIETYNTSSATKVLKLPVGILVNILRGSRIIAFSLETSK